MAGEAEMTNFANDTDRLIQHNEEHSWEQQVRTNGSHDFRLIESKVNSRTLLLSFSF